jgi:hypothetical protein
MNDSMDGYIRQALKNWAVEQQPPANGRARLLLLAASPSAQRAYYENQHASSLEHAQSANFPVNPASEFYDLPWLLAVQLTYTTLRRVT